MWKRLAVLLTVLVLVAAACGDDDGPAAIPAPATDAPGPDATTAPTAPDVGQPAGGGTLAAVLARGVLRCGVSGSAVAFSETQPDGSQLGFDADFCRALAAAVLGDANAVEFRPVTSAERFDVLKSGDVDVLFRNTTETQSRDASGEGGVNVDFGPVTYYDGQGLMGASSRFSADSGPADVDGAILCTSAGTTSEKNIVEWANIGNASITVEAVENINDAIAKFKAGACDLVTTDASALVGHLVNNERDGSIAVGDWVVFPPAPISKEPLGPAFRQNDSEWGDIVTWLIYALITADEKGITSQNIDTVTLDPEGERLLGKTDGEVQTKQGLTADAWYNAIKQVGNYDEIFTRNLNPVNLFREGSLNATFTEGGMIYSNPSR